MNTMTQRMSDILKQRPLLITGAALLVGILVGWFVIGWGLWPVEFVNADVSQLRPDLQQAWVRLAASEYALNPNIERAAARVDALGPKAPQVISDTLTTSTGDEKIRVLLLKQVLEELRALSREEQERARTRGDRKPCWNGNIGKST